MSYGDQQVSDNLKKLSKIDQKHQKLIKALKKLNQAVDRTYGLSVKLEPKKGIYCIEDGKVKAIEISGSDLDRIKTVEFISEPKPKVKLTYGQNQILILD